jgi:hypothetical protein
MLQFRIRIRTYLVLLDPDPHRKYGSGSENKDVGKPTLPKKCVWPYLNKHDLLTDNITYKKYYLLKKTYEVLLSLF